MIFDLINFKTIRRLFLYTGYIFLCFLAQELIFSRIEIFGVNPGILPAAIVAVSVFEGGIRGGVFGLLLGMLGDISYGNTVLFTVIFPFIGFLAGAVSEFYTPKSYFGFLYLTLGGLFVTAFAQGFVLLVFMPDQSLFAIIVEGTKEIIISMIPSAALFVPCREIYEANTPI